MSCRMCATRYRTEYEPFSEKGECPACDRIAADNAAKKACKSDEDYKKEYLSGNRQVEFSRTGGFS